jgi:hypothetical protein
MNTQIRITKTPDIEKIIQAIQSRYLLLNDVDIIKMALSNQYHTMFSSDTDADPTEYLNKSIVNRIRLEEAINQPTTTAKKFKSTKELANELGIDY